MDKEAQSNRLLKPNSMNRPAENNAAHQQDMPDDSTGVERPRWKGVLKRFGLAGFLFFFLKGLVWIAIFAFGWKGCDALRDTDRAGMGPDDPEISAHELLPLQRFDQLFLLGFVLQVDKSKTL